MVHYELRFEDGTPAGCFRYHTAGDARRWALLMGGSRAIHVVRVLTVRAETPVVFKPYLVPRAA